MEDLQKELTGNFSARMDKMQNKVEASQATSLQEVMAKTSKKVYHFKHKGNENQLNFNLTVKDHLDAPWKRAWKRSCLRTLREREAAEELNNGKEAIRIRQKHICIADCSDWEVVSEYLADELADDSED